MTKAEIYKKVLREYEKEKRVSDEIYQKRISDIYLLIPDIKNIDTEIMKINMEFAKASLKKLKVKYSISELKEKNKELLKKREDMLEQYGINKSFFDDIYKCGKCKDTGYIDNKPCQCLKKRLIEAAYDMSNIKEILKNENFENFDISFYPDNNGKDTEKSPRKKIESILLKAFEFVKNFDDVFMNLYLYGKSGLGKTFLCNCIAKELLDKSKSVLYLSASQLFKMLEKDTFKNDTEEFSEVLKLIFDADLLIIDDLGTEFQTSFTSSEFFNIINLRYIKKKPVVISTNLGTEDIIDKYSDRVISRLYGNYEFLEFIGEDIRILKLTKGQYNE